MICFKCRKPGKRFRVINAEGAVICRKCELEFYKAHTGTTKPKPPKKKEAA